MKHLISLAALIIGLSVLTSYTPIALADDAAKGDDSPSIVKSSVLATAFTLNQYQKNYDVWSWMPSIQFRVNGPVPSGSQLWVEYTLPTGPWVKFDCKTQEVKRGHWLKVEGGGHDVPEDKGITTTGPVDFKIHVRNELAGTDSVLFTGKFNVSKAHSNEAGPKAVEHNVYYVDQDWNLPIGYVYLVADKVQGMKLPTLNVAFWARGDAVQFQPHLFYKGEEVGKIFLDTTEMGKASAGADIQNEPTHYVDGSLPEKATWSRIVCNFPNIKGWDKTSQPPAALPGQKGSRLLLKDNPGEYEVKVLWKDKLARSIKFTVRPDGTLDDGITVANTMGDNHAIVPVQIIGDQDGKWDQDAWKTHAFYDNPLTGFTALPPVDHP